MTIGSDGAAQRLLILMALRLNAKNAGDYLVKQGTDLVLKNIQAIAELEQRAIQQRSTIERITDAVTAITGSMAFVAIHALVFAGWIAVNLRGAWAFDRFPFSLLNLGVSLEAIFLMSFVLMTQNRMTSQADKRAHLDLQVNLLAEQELTAILHMSHALCQRAGVRVDLRDERIAELLKDTNIQSVAVALEKSLADEQTAQTADD